ncbi:hypothetical protein [Komagataeibacter phage phiKX2]|nr:hypothetical protein [Komagataeibacter phage phiKX2]
MPVQSIDYSMSNLRIEQKKDYFLVLFDAVVYPRLTGVVLPEEQWKSLLSTMKMTVETHVQDLPAKTAGEWENWTRERLMQLLGSTLPKPATDVR